MKAAVFGYNHLSGQVYKDRGGGTHAQKAVQPFCVCRAGDHSRFYARRAHHRRAHLAACDMADTDVSRGGAMDLVRHVRAELDHCLSYGAARRQPRHGARDEDPVDFVHCHLQRIRRGDLCGVLIAPPEQADAEKSAHAERPRGAL